MSPRRDGEDVWFSVAQAADILGVKRQALHMAITEGRLEATDKAYGREIHAKDLLAFGIRSGGDPNELARAVQKEADVDLWQMVVWVLAGLGLAWLIVTLLRKS